MLNSDEGVMPVHEPNAARAIWPSLWNTPKKEVLTCFPGFLYNGPIITARLCRWRHPKDQS